MIIIKIWAGLANQMFEYALYKSLLSTGKCVKMDTSYFYQFHIHNGYELEKIFDIRGNYASYKECDKLANIKLDKFNRFIRKYVYQKKTQIVPEPERCIYYMPEVFNYENAYLQGYWQSEKYFKKVETEIREDFKFKLPLGKENESIAYKIKNTNSVAIHVRRGDYLNKNIYNSLGRVCTIQYYKNAVEKIISQVADAKFYLFSDDADWSRENMGFFDFEFIDINRGDNSYKDMQLMSLCKHNIIANSTFSWWAAWLNNNSRKMVISPNQWFADGAIGDIIPETWIKLTT